jgi:hypothetical protein
MDGVMDGVSSQPEPVTTPSAGRPVLVLDNNVLRNERVIEGCIARYLRTGEQFALPSMAMFELTKHPDAWESTVRKSLEYVGRSPDALVITHTAKDLGALEEVTGKPTEQVVSDKMTSAWRKLLADIRTGDGPDLDYFRWAVTTLRKEMRYEEYETDTRALIQKLRDIARSTFPRDLIARIGGDLARGERATFRELVAGVIRVEQQRDAHVRRGVPKDLADALLDAPGVSYLFALAVGVVALDWLFRGGIESAKPRTVANDVLDIEYIIPALWIGGLVARDDGARERFDDLKVLGAATWPSHAQWFGRAQTVHPDDL